MVGVSSAWSQPRFWGNRFGVIDIAFRLLRTLRMVVMLNDKDVPLIHEDIGDFDAIALNRRRAVMPGQDPILHLVLWVDVALKAAVSFGKAIE